MQVSQVFFSDNPDAPLPPFIEQATQTVRNACPAFDYKLYNDKEIQELIAENFQPLVLECYNKLNSYSYKSDLARYCLLYLYGGWYFDATVRCMRGITLDERIKIFGFRDVNKYIGTTHAVDGCVIYSREKNEQIFLDAINICTDHISTNYYGWCPLCVTGPIVWGDVIVDNFEPEHYFFGDVMDLTPGHIYSNKALVLPDGALFGLKKPAAGGDLTKLGIEGTNNYNELWESRTIYK